MDVADHFHRRFENDTDLAVLVVAAHQVVVIITIHQQKRAYLIPAALAAENTLHLHIIIKVFEAHTDIFINGGVDVPYIVVDVGVHVFDPVGNHHLPLQLL